MQKNEFIPDFFKRGEGVVTICGSTRYYFEALELNRILTFEGWAVFACGSWGHSFHKYSSVGNLENSTAYNKVKALHFHKILLSSAIVVVSDITGYIGESTKEEINFAEFNQIPVFYYNGEKFSGYSGLTISSFDQRKVAAERAMIAIMNDE